MNKILLSAVIMFFLVGCSKGGSVTDPTIPLPEEPTTGILYQWDFEGENPLHDLGELTSDAQVAIDPLNAANKAMKFTLNTGSYRSEASVGNPMIHYFYADSDDPSTGQEMWIGVRIFVMPQGYEGTNTSLSIFQIGPVQNLVSFPGQTSAGHMQLKYDKNRTQWWWREYSSQFNPNSYSGMICASDYGKWERFVLHARIRSDNNGVIDVWRNGIRVYNSVRQNSVVGDRTRIKWGIYVGADNTVTKPITCYFDDIKIGGATSSYVEVAP